MNDKKKSISIIIIDSGVDTSISDLKDYLKVSTGYIINDQGYIIENNQLPARSVHGTAIALIIRHICPEVNIISMNILNERGFTDGRLAEIATKDN